MKHPFLPTCSAALSIAVTLALAGCGNDGQQTESGNTGHNFLSGEGPVREQPQDQEPSPESTAGETPEATEGSVSMDQVKEQAQAAMDSASEAGQQALKAASEALGIAQEEGGALADMAKAQAQDLVNQAQRFLAENNIRSAQDVVQKLNDLDLKLPESLQRQLDQIKAQIAQMQSAQAAPESSTDQSGAEGAQ